MEIHVFIVSDHTATDIPLHTHDFFQLIYCKSGTGRITLGDKSYTAEPGTVYLAPPGVSHAIRNTGDLTLMECKFRAYGSMEKQLLSLPLSFCIDSNPEALTHLKNVIREGFSKIDHCNLSADANLLLFFVQVFRMLTNAKEQAVQQTYAYLDVCGNNNEDCEILMLNLLPYLEDHLSEKITLDMLSQKVHFNKTYFIRRFKSLWGCSPMQYVNQLRLRNAKNLLLTTDEPLSVIAQRCGFASPHYFSRRFRDEFGQSPQFYRAEHKNKVHRSAFDG